MSGWFTLADPQEVVPELTTRIVVLASDDRPEEMPIISNPDAVWEILDGIGDLDREGIWVLPLDDDRRLIGVYVAHIGGTSFSVVDPSVIVRLLLAVEATKFVLVHNHPSGDATPSPEDQTITLRLLRAAALFEIPMADHIVIGRDNLYTSFRELGWLDEYEELAEESFA